jgi:hypothetical protein
MRKHRFCRWILALILLHGISASFLGLTFLGLIDPPGNSLQTLSFCLFICSLRGSGQVCSGYNVAAAVAVLGPVGPVPPGGGL